MKMDVENGKGIDIFVFTNGQGLTPPRKYHLMQDELLFWDVTLKQLAHIHYGSAHSVINLYTIDGYKTNGPEELHNGEAYVAVIPPEPFIDSGYENYLIKATRSWEKRQLRKRSTASAGIPKAGGVGDNETIKTSGAGITQDQDHTDISPIVPNVLNPNKSSNYHKQAPKLKSNNVVRKNTTSSNPPMWGIVPAKAAHMNKKLIAQKYTRIPRKNDKRNKEKSPVKTVIPEGREEVANNQLMSEYSSWAPTPVDVLYDHKSDVNNITDNKNEPDDYYNMGSDATSYFVNANPDTQKPVVPKEKPVEESFKNRTISHQNKPPFHSFATETEINNPEYKNISNKLFFVMTKEEIENSNFNSRDKPQESEVQEKRSKTNKFPSSVDIKLVAINNTTVTDSTSLQSVLNDFLPHLCFDPEDSFALAQCPCESIRLDPKVLNPEIRTCFILLPVFGRTAKECCKCKEARKSAKPLSDSRNLPLEVKIEFFETEEQHSSFPGVHGLSAAAQTEDYSCHCASWFQNLHCASCGGKMIYSTADVPEIRTQQYVPEAVFLHRVSATKLLNTSEQGVQTDWSNVMLEARPQGGTGLYKLYLPSLEMLKLYNLNH